MVSLRLEMMEPAIFFIRLGESGPASKIQVNQVSIFPLFHHSILGLADIVVDIVIVFPTIALVQRSPKEANQYYTGLVLEWTYSGCPKSGRPDFGIFEKCPVFRRLLSI